MQEITEYEESALRNLGYVFDYNEWVGKKRDEIGWSNVRKENDQFVVRGSGVTDGQKKDFIRFYDSIGDIRDGKETKQRTNNEDA